MYVGDWAAEHEDHTANCSGSRGRSQLCYSESRLRIRLLSCSWLSRWRWLPVSRATFRHAEQPSSIRWFRCVTSEEIDRYFEPAAAALTLCVVNVSIAGPIRSVSA